jgi:hypothetical protein
MFPIGNFTKISPVKAKFDTCREMDNRHDEADRHFL